MFERFTDRARRSIVLAQEEAHRLQHNYIGTEHVLLGLLGEQGGVAARAGERFGLTLAAGRDDVLAIIGRGKQEAGTHHIPFTPRAKKCLELALREALALGHEYIGTEHILLGIVREGDGVAARILEKHAGSLSAVRAAVVELLPPSSGPQGRRWLRRMAALRPAVAFRPELAPELRTTPAADTSLEEAARLAGPNPVGSHHIMLAALADPTSAAARTLVALGVDLDRAREALRSADVTGSSDELPEEAGRRQMSVTVTSDRVTVEASDAAIVQLGRSAVDAISRAVRSEQPSATGRAPGADGVIRGDHPFSVGLSLVWQALHDSLEDIGRRASAGEAPPAEPAPSADPAPPTAAAPPGDAAGDG